jgi:hypothetical protein
MRAIFPMIFHSAASAPACREADTRAALSIAKSRNKTLPSLIYYADDKFNRSNKHEIRNVDQDQDCLRGRPHPRHCFGGSGGAG